MIPCFRCGVDRLGCEGADTRQLEARYKDTSRDANQFLDGADINYVGKYQESLSQAWKAYTQSL